MNKRDASNVGMISFNLITYGIKKMFQRSLTGFGTLKLRI